MMRSFLGNVNIVNVMVVVVTDVMVVVEAVSRLSTRGGDSSCGISVTLEFKAGGNGDRVAAAVQV